MSRSQTIFFIVKICVLFISEITHYYDEIMGTQKVNKMPQNGVSQNPPRANIFSHIKIGQCSGILSFGLIMVAGVQELYMILCGTHVVRIINVYQDMSSNLKINFKWSV